MTSGTFIIFVYRRPAERIDRGNIRARFEVRRHTDLRVGGVVASELKAPNVSIDLGYGGERQYMEATLRPIPTRTTQLPAEATAASAQAFAIAAAGGQPARGGVGAGTGDAQKRPAPQWYGLHERKRRRAG